DDAVDPDAVRPELLGQGSGQPLDARLGGAVHDEVTELDVGADRPQVDHRPPPGGLHHGRYGTDGEVVVVEIDAHALVPKSGVDLWGRVPGIVGSIIDQHAHRAQRPRQLGDHPLVPGDVADVGVPVHRPGGAGGGDGLDQGVTRVVLEVHERHAGALSGKLRHELRSQAGGAATDHYHLVPQTGVGGKGPG